MSRSRRRRFRRSLRQAAAAWDGFAATVWYVRGATDELGNSWTGNPHRDEWQAEYLRRYVVAKREAARLRGEYPPHGLAQQSAREEVHR